jgi:hypothetical protein
MMKLMKKLPKSNWPQHGFLYFVQRIRSRPRRNPTTMFRQRYTNQLSEQSMTATAENASQSDKLRWLPHLYAKQTKNGLLST